MEGVGVFHLYHSEFETSGGREGRRKEGKTDTGTGQMGRSVYDVCY